MRWNGSLVAEAFRILVRGGVFLYPGDSRPDYHNGRLRLLGFDNDAQSAGAAMVVYRGIAV